MQKEFLKSSEGFLRANLLQCDNKFLVLLSFSFFINHLFLIFKFLFQKILAHIYASTSTLMNPTNPRTNLRNFREKSLRIGDFKKWAFFESAILNFFFGKFFFFFCFIPMKISPNLLGRMDGLKFWPDFWVSAKLNKIPTICATTKFFSMGSRKKINRKRWHSRVTSTGFSHPFGHKLIRFGGFRGLGGWQWREISRQISEAANKFEKWKFSK